jgi:hypothetical protein
MSETRYPCCDHCQAPHRTDRHIIPCVRCGLTHPHEQVRKEQDVAGFEKDLWPLMAMKVNPVLQAIAPVRGSHHKQEEDTLVNVE